MPAPPPEALGVTDAAQVARIAPRLTPHPLRTFEQPARLTAAAAALPRAFVHCTAGPVAPSFAPFAAQARAAPGWRFHELDTGHDAMITVPDQLAGLLRALAMTPE